MALKNRSLFLYGIEVTESNSSMDFRAVIAGPEIRATLSLGFYSLTSLLQEVARVMTVADPTRTYTATADRTAGGGLQNRTTITTDGTFLTLLFGTGTRAATSIGPLLGYTATDKVGALFYVGSFTTGTTLSPDLVGYNYLSNDFNKQVQGVQNLSASGEIEAVVFQVMPFWQVQFKYEIESKVVLEWTPLIDWMIQKKLLEFTPDVTAPTVFFEGTLDKSAADSKGMGHKWSEMLPDFPFQYDSGLLIFRKRLGGTQFV